MKLERYTPGLAKRMAVYPSRAQVDSVLSNEAQVRARSAFIDLRDWGRHNRKNLTLVDFKEVEVAPPSLGNMLPRYEIVDAVRDYQYQGILHGSDDALNPHVVTMNVKTDVFRGGQEKPMFVNMTFPDPADPLVSLFFSDTPLEIFKGVSEEDFLHPRVYSQGNLILRVPDLETGAAIDQKYSLTTLHPSSVFARTRYGFGLYEYPGAQFRYGSPDLFEYSEHLVRFLSSARVVGQ